MGILCILYCDGLQARIYRTACLPAQFPAQLTLSYQQVNFGGLLSDFVASLCKMLRTELTAGKFKSLVLVAPANILDMFDKQMDQNCRARLLAKIARDVGSPPDDKDLLALLRQTLRGGINGAPVRVPGNGQT